ARPPAHRSRALPFAEIQRFFRHLHHVHLRGLRRLRVPLAVPATGAGALAAARCPLDDAVRDRQHRRRVVDPVFRAADPAGPAARDTLGAALEMAGGLPSPANAELASAAREAFTAALRASCGTAAIICATLATAAWFLLERSRAGDQDSSAKVHSQVFTA